jgi:hypothetical protein
LSGCQIDGSRRKIASTSSNESTTWMRAPLPPWSGLSIAGQVISSACARSAAGSLNVIERGVSIRRVRSSVACTLLLSSSANTSAPLSTRAPQRSSVRMYASASGTARVLPRTYALGLAWLKYSRARGGSLLLKAARVTSNGSNATPRRSSAAKSGFCHSGCSCRTMRSGLVLRMPGRSYRAGRSRTDGMAKQAMAEQHPDTL